MDNSQFNLEQHLRDEHQQSPLAEFLKEIVYGGIDGIVTTFAVVASFSGAALSGADPATASFITVLLFGMGNLFADGASMGLGEYLSSRSEQDLINRERKKELQEITSNPAQEIIETTEILKLKGFNEEDATVLSEIYQRNPEYWTDWMLHNELQLTSVEADNPMLSGFATFISFIIFGAIPLIPFALFANLDTQTVFIISSVATIFALVMLGLLRWKVTREKLFRSIGEVVIIGSAAAIVAFLVGTLFG